MAKPRQYKKEKLAPIPEVAKPLSHRKKKKRYLLEQRMTVETLQRSIKYYREEIEKLQKNEWREEGKYSDMSSAQKAHRQKINQQESYRKYWQKHSMSEYRIREIEEDEG